MKDKGITTPSVQKTQKVKRDRRFGRRDSVMTANILRAHTLRAKSIDGSSNGSSNSSGPTETYEDYKKQLRTGSVVHDYGSAHRTDKTEDKREFEIHDAFRLFDLNSIMFSIYDHLQRLNISPNELAGAQDTMKMFYNLYHIRHRHMRIYKCGHAITVGSRTWWI